MNKVLKHILYAVLAAALLGCIAASYVAGVRLRRPIVCKGVRIEILDSAENSFVSVSDVRRFIDKSCGRIIGEKLDSIDLVMVEKAVDSRSAVLKSHAYVTRDSMLNIKVTQRRPVVRFQKKDGGFYADSEGYIFPLQSTYASHVQIIDGEIPLAANSGYKGDLGSQKEKDWFRSIMRIVNYMENSRVWKDKIVQISVADNGELTLIPREGQEKFLFGHPHSMIEKFNKMERYYTTIIPEKGKNRYSIIDLRFRNQIVCK